MSWTPLIVTAASDAYFWLSVVFRDLLGPDYSRLRYDLILVNLAAALAAAILLCFRKTVARWSLLAASLFLALTWLLVGAISSVV